MTDDSSAATADSDPGDTDPADTDEPAEDASEAPDAPRLSPGRRRLFALVATLLMLGVGELGARVVLLIRDRRKRRRFAAKAPGETRLLVLGGSTAFGFPDPALGFAAGLEARLGPKSGAGSVAVLNLAKPGKAADDVLEALHESADAEPDLVLVYSGHNEFLKRRIKPSGAAILTSRELLDRLALVRLLRLMLRRERFDGPLTLPDKVLPVRPDDPLRAAKLEAYRERLTAIAALCRERRVPLVICTVSSNLRDWPPVWRGVGWSTPLGTPAYEELIRGRLAELDAAASGERPGRAATLLSTLKADLKTLPADPMLLWLRGRAQLITGDGPGARLDLLAARRADPIPWRGLPAINQAIRELARRHDHVHLIDLAAAIEAPDERPPGFELFLDNCHPNPTLHARMSDLIADGIVAAGVLPALQRTPAGPPSLDGKTRAALARRSALYALKEPFLNARAARRHLAAARATGVEDWRIDALAGIVELFDGEGPASTERAIGLLAEAAKARGAPLDPADNETTPYLLSALNKRGVDVSKLDWLKRD